MTTQSVSSLRQRMIEDMSIRQFGRATQNNYVRVVRDFAAFLGRSPDLAEPEDLRRYQLRTASLGASPAQMNMAVSALRFFFKTTLGRGEFGERLATVRTPERPPVVLSPEEVALLLHCAPSLKHRAALSVAYGGGLRASEIVHLKVGDIDSARMLRHARSSLTRAMASRVSPPAACRFDPASGAFADLRRDLVH